MKNATRLDHFETLNRRLQWQAQWILTFKKVSQPWGFAAQFAEVGKMTAGVGPLKIICKDEFRGAGAVRETCPSDGRGADLPRGSIRSSALP